MVKFSDLEVCQKFQSKDKTKILKYIETLYSKSSPLQKVQNLLDRKIAACKEAKLSPTDESVIEIMDLKNKEVNNLIFAFHAVFQDNNKMTNLAADQQLLWNIQQLMLSNPMVIDEDELSDRYKKRIALSDMADSLEKRVARLIGEIFFHEDVKKDVASAGIRQMLRPEERLAIKEAS